jgi:uncharacterized protein (TIGR02246 family)
MKNVFISFFCIGIVWSATGQTVQMVQDSQNIQALLDGMSKAWNIHDAKTYSAAFSEEADFTDVSGMSVFGRKAIQALCEKSFAAGFKNSSLNITNKKIRYITNDILAVDVWWAMKDAQAADGKNIPFSKGIANLLITRDGNRWLILIMHNMNLPAFGLSGNFIKAEGNYDRFTPPLQNVIMAG